ncbi:hypothetical protein B0H34DRAFT_862491 [Crassisporium funariophilum]|nr:hypothetical protein B0H34DRAFT_862491 [Crassisporium funariophilum]
MNPFNGTIARRMLDDTDENLMRFKVNFLGMPSEIAQHKFFDKDNVTKWAFVVEQYRKFVTLQLAQSGRKTPTMPPTPDQDSSSSGESEIGDTPRAVLSKSILFSLSDDENEEHMDGAAATPVLQKRKHATLEAPDTPTQAGGNRTSLTQKLHSAPNKKMAVKREVVELTDSEGDWEAAKVVAVRKEKVLVDVSDKVVIDLKKEPVVIDLTKSP